MTDTPLVCQRRPLPLKALLAAALVALGGCGPSPPSVRPDAATARQAPDDNAVDDLLRLMRQRLLLMHEVARWKWNAAKPITDPIREKELLASVEKRGLRYGLSAHHARSFMAAQMEAGKLMQHADFAAWKAKDQSRFADIRDLTTDLRPLITQLSNQMLAQLAKLTPSVDDDQFTTHAKQRADAILRGEGIDDAVRSAAISPLLETFD